MFDAAMKTALDRKKYSNFLKQLKGKGYIMLQKSVYYSFNRSNISFESEARNIKKIVYSDIKVRMLSLPIKYILDMKNFNCEKIINDDTRVEFI